MTAIPMFPAPVEGSVYPAPIKSVEVGSPADRAGVRPGDQLLRINGEAVTDILAYRHKLSQGKAVLEVIRPHERPFFATPQDHHTVKADEEAPHFFFEVEWEDPGLEFEEVLFDSIKKCVTNVTFVMSIRCRAAFVKACTSWMMITAYHSCTALSLP